MMMLPEMMKFLMTTLLSAIIRWYVVLRNRDTAGTRWKDLLRRRASSAHVSSLHVSRVRARVSVQAWPRGVSRLLQERVQLLPLQTTLGGHQLQHHPGQDHQPHRSSVQIRVRDSQHYLLCILRYSNKCSATMQSNSFLKYFP